MGGIATSILFSAFESWLVNEHNRVIKHLPYLTYAASSLNQIQQLIRLILEGIE